MKRCRVIVLWAAAVLSAAPTAAHDFWIEPSSYRPRQDDILKVALRVGENFEGTPVPRKDEKITTFSVRGPDGEKPVVGRDGQDPAGIVRVAQPGLHVIGYRGKRSSIEMEAAKFEAYLKEEGLNEIVKLRAERKESDKPAREVYSRCAKSFFQCGDTKGEGYDKPLGYTLELTTARDPYTLHAGDELTVQVLYEGKPLKGVAVRARSKDKPGEPLEERSDKDGRVSFKLARGGVWLITCVHMIPAPSDAKADYESFWASLTFELPAGK